MKKSFHKKDSKGFTIVELMIATTVFSFILLVTSAGVIAIGRAYYKSLTSTRVQETARSVMDDITRSLQFSGGGSVFTYTNNPDGTPAAVKAKCFGSDRYTYRVGQKIEDSKNALYRDTKPVEGCVPATACFDNPNKSACNGKELLGGNMRLLQFDLSGTPLKLSLKVAYGDDDLLEVTQCEDGTLVGGVCQNPSDEDMATIQCRGGIAGSNFCATSQLETSVTSRVK